jgi:hypothetical protein
MGKYDALGHFLRGQRGGEVPMTFAEIERLTATKLPPSAHRHRPWWSNNARNSVMTKVWLEAGFRTEQVDMEGRKLVFRRVRNPAEGKVLQPSVAAKDTRHPALGALKGLVQILPGTDLTEPVDPAWGSSWDEG